MSTTADEETSSAERGATTTDPGRERTAAEMTGMTGERELHSSAEGTTFKQSIMSADSGEMKQRFLVHSEYEIFHEQGHKHVQGFFFRHILNYTGYNQK